GRRGAGDGAVVGVGRYGGSKIGGERVCLSFAQRGLDVAIIRPKTFIGPERLGVFEILFDWVHNGRGIYMLGDGTNRYQLLAVEDLVEAVLPAAPPARAPGPAGHTRPPPFGARRPQLRPRVGPPPS